MDAVKYLKEKKRIFKTYCCPEFTQANCTECPYNDNGSCQAGYPDSILSIEGQVAIVEQWSKKNPIKTNRKKFEEVFGISPSLAGYQTNHTRAEGLPVEWWNKEYIDPKGE